MARRQPHEPGPPAPDTYEPPFVGWFPADWAGSLHVGMLDAAQRGVYRELLDLVFRMGSFPLDYPQLARLTRLAVADLEHAWPAVRHFFDRRDDGRWTNDKAAGERQRAFERSSKARDKALSKAEQQRRHAAEDAAAALAAAGAAAPPQQVQRHTPERGNARSSEGAAKPTPTRAAKNACPSAAAGAAAGAAGGAPSPLSPHVEKEEGNTTCSPGARSARPDAPVDVPPPTSVDPDKPWADPEPSTAVAVVETKPKRERKPPTGPEADARRAWDADWLTARGAAFAWDAKHASAMAHVVKLAGGDLAEIQRRQRIMLAHPDAFQANNASPTWLRSRWNELATPPRVNRSQLNAAQREIVDVQSKLDMLRHPATRDPNNVPAILRT